MFYFYIIQSQKNKSWFYKGVTANISKRIQRHNRGEVFSTKPHRPFRVVYYEAYVSREAAKKREVSVKRSGSVSIPLLKRIRESLIK